MEQRRQPSPAELRLLDWVADQVASGGLSFQSLPTEEQVPRALFPADMPTRHVLILARRWTVLLSLAAQRPDKCAQALLRGLLADGFDPRTVQRAGGRVVPRIAASLGSGALDTAYVEAELLNVSRPSYASRIAVAQAALRYDRKLAESMALAARELEPQKFDADLCLAAICENAALFAEACKHYESAARKGCGDCHVRWAAALNRAGKPQLALDIIARAGVAQTEELVREKARALRSLHRFEEALACYGALGQKDIDVQAEIAACHLDLGHPLRAIEAARNGVAAGHGAALRVAGLAYFRERAWGNAARDLGRAVELDADADLQIWRSLAQSTLMVGQYDRAISAAQSARNLAPRDQEAGWVLAQALVLSRRYDEALRLCADEGPQLLPLPYLALTVIEVGQYAEAAELLRTWLDRRPNDVMAWLFMGYLSERQGRLDEALAYYGEAWRRNPGHVQARNRYQNLQDAMEYELVPEAVRVPDALATGDVGTETQLP